MDLTPVTDLVAKIPGSAWAAIGGALLTLIPVIVSNRHNRKQQEQQQAFDSRQQAQQLEFESRQQAQQLEFDSRERQRERQVALRRDVYLPAADALIGMVGALGKLLRVDPLSADQIAAGALTFGAAITRIQMVATAETVRLVAEYQRCFLTALSTLQRLNHPMMLRQTDIDLAHDARQGYHDERMKCIELMKEYNLSGVRDPERFHRFEQQAAFASQGWAKEHSEWLRLMFAQETARLDLMREFVAQMTQLAKLQATALAAIRGELESGVDDAALIEEEAQKTAVVGVQTANDMIPLIESTIAGLRDDVEADEQQRRQSAGHG